MKVVMIGLLAALAATQVWGEDALLETARRAVMAKLHDPESARFADLRAVTSQSGPAVCGRVNAKNRAGGYDGFRPFLYSPNPDFVIIYGGRAVTDDVVSHLAKMKGFEDSCGASIR